MPCPHCGAPEAVESSGRCPRCGVPAEHVATATEVPASLDTVAHRELGDRFAIGAVLAASSYGLRFLAEERETGGQVVLRVFALDALRDLQLARPLQHALLAETALDHPHLHAAYRSGTTAHLVWSATPVVEGRTLARALAFGGPLSAAASVRLVRQLVAGLTELHQRGLVHGAVAPATVLIGEDDRARLADIGVDRLLRSAPGFIEHARRRHPAYDPPEVARGAHLAPAEDQYGLAVTLCECLTGPWPVEGNGISSGMSADALVAHVMRGRPDLPASFRTALRRALSPRPADRYPDVRAFGAALEGITAAASPATTVAAHHDQTPDAESPHVIFVNGSPRQLVLRAGARLALAGVVVALGALQLFRADPVLPRLAPAVVYAPVDPTPTMSPAAPPGPARQESGGLALPDTLGGDPGSGATTAGTRMTPGDSARLEAMAAEAERAAAIDTSAAAAVDTPTRRETPPPRDPSPPASGRQPGIIYQQSPGRLFVSSRPWGQLYVDGQFVGNTPVANLPLTVGTHRLRITREGFAPEERDIVVESGRDIRLIDIILRRIPP
ncbi:MAG TPA: protein kinase [Gemmatimonadaceae bacterium]